MDPSVTRPFEELGVALLLGLLVGLQQQRTDGGLPGIRSVALTTVLGTLAMQVAAALESPWIVAAALVGVVALAAVVQESRLTRPGNAASAVSYLSLIVMFLTGVLIVAGSRAVAVAVGVGVAVLQQFRPELHGFAARLGDRDLRAFLQFLLITFVVLPVLPERLPYLEHVAWLQVVNPHEIWWMVVLIVGIGLAAYAAHKLLGPQRGVLVSGLLGGAISSTATTVTHARRSRQQPALVPLAAVSIALAALVVYARVLLEVGVVALAAEGAASTDDGRGWRFLAALAAPVGAMAAASAGAALLLWYARPDTSAEALEHDNPSELRPALIFAAVYAVVLVALDQAKQWAPEQGPLVVAALSGLTDIDAIVLSTARLVTGGTMDPGAGQRIVLVALLASLVAKGLIIGALGPRRLWGWSLVFLGPPLAAGLAALWWR